MPRRISPTLLVVLFVIFSSVAASARGLAPAVVGRSHSPRMAALLQVNDREQDGLHGPVRRVRTETAKITVKNGKPLEGPRVLLETTTYDNKGARVDNAYFLAAGGSLTGKEVYRYDERGHIVEMTLTNADGSLQSRETYTYEFDAMGNWTKMTTHVAVIEGGKVSFEPTEVTYRVIAYYLEEASVARLSQPATPAPSPAAPANTNAATQPKSAAPLISPSAAAAGNESRTATSDSLALTTGDKPFAAASPSASMNTDTNAGAGPAVKSEGEASATENPARSGPLKPISGGILNGKALSLPAPIYPDIAKRARAMGTVEVEVVIDLTGKVISAKAVKGPAMLRGTAEQAARNARFSPTLLTGQPVRVSGTITYNFSLGQ